MQTISEIRTLLDERGLRPKRRFGQNFLHDKNQLAKLVAAAALAPGEVALEVGPGTGTLTDALLDAGVEVVVSEIDDDMVQIIEDRLGGRVTIVRGDCLERGRRISPAILEAIGDRPFKLVANLPYQAASPLLTALLLDTPGCRGQYVTIQKEVADRLLAAPGSKAYGPLGIIVGALGTVRRIATVKPASFWPAPKVTSAMVAIEPAPASGPASQALDDPHGFARFVREVFSKRRKQVGTIFGRDHAWPEGITADARPDSLSIDLLIALWRSVWPTWPA